MENIIERLKKDDMKDIFKQNNIEGLALVGSYARGEQKQSSDIDLVFTLNKNAKMTLFSLLRVKRFLEEKLYKEVDLIEESSINTHYKNSVFADKKIIF